MFSTCLTTGTKEHESSELVKVLTGLIIIGAFIVGVLTGQGYVGPQIAALAAGAGAMALTLSLSTLAIALLNPSSLRSVRIIGKAANLIGIVATLAGFMAVVQQTYQRLAQAFVDEAADQGLKRTVADYSVAQFVADYTSSVVSSFADSFSFELSVDGLLSKLGSVSFEGLNNFINNLNAAMNLYSQFFAAVPSQEQTNGADTQDTQHRPEAYYAMLDQLDEVDALYKMSILIEGAEGGNLTQRLIDSQTP
jgi:hypothetical protein